MSHVTISPPKHQFEYQRCAACYDRESDLNEIKAHGNSGIYRRRIALLCNDCTVDLSAACTRWLNEPLKANTVPPEQTKP